MEVWEPESNIGEYVCEFEEDTSFMPQTLPGLKDKKIPSSNTEVEETNRSQSDRFSQITDIIISEREDDLNAQQNEPAVYRTNLDAETPLSVEYNGDQVPDMVTHTFHQFQSTPTSNCLPNEHGRVRDIGLARRQAFNEPKSWGNYIFRHKKESLSDRRVEHTREFSSVASSLARNTEPKKEQTTMMEEDIHRSPPH